MPTSKHVLCIATAKPSTSPTSGGGGGSMTLVDPDSGAILKSLRPGTDVSGQKMLGLLSLSAFPLFRGTQSHHSSLVIAYGTNAAKKGDTYALLMGVRQASSPPVVQWKCRLPESDMTAGLIVSPCGHYIASGSASGTCYVWSSLVAGHLLRAFKAHYRAVTCVTWSGCGRYLITGGSDGMVHCFPLLEIVDRSNRSSKRAIAPLCTWSCHHFPIRCIVSMESGRFASGSEDGLIVLMEIFSKGVLATIKVPHGVTCMTYYDRRLYAGSTHGIIFSVDLDTYSMHQSLRQGAMVSQNFQKKRKQISQDKYMVLGEQNDGARGAFLSDWVGHSREVTSILATVDCGRQLLISGDGSGQVRIWDVESRTCVRVLQPWHNAVEPTRPPREGTTKQRGPPHGGDHPITSIVSINLPAESSSKSSKGMFQRTQGKMRRQVEMPNLVEPLQKYTQVEQNDHHDDKVRVLHMKASRRSRSERFWQPRRINRKRMRHQPSLSLTTNDSNNNGTMEQSLSMELIRRTDQILHLEAELVAARQEASRWETCNNRLMSKLSPRK